MEETVKVFIRIRPPFDYEVKSEDFKKCVSLQENIVTLSYPRDTTREFCFDGAFQERTTETQVFEASALPLVESVLQGYSGTLFVYGQTGTGKTHTMGLLKKLNPKSDGIVPRSVKMLIDSLPRGGVLSLSFLQIYLENIYDLLSAEGKALPLREDASGEVFVRDLVQVRLHDTTQAISIINSGLANRIMGSQNVNQTSSRSHIVLQLNVDLTSNTGTMSSRLTLVDLAGSERVRKTNSTGLRLDEARFINASLSTLGKVISSLVNQNSTHIPYRDSKLTRVLKPSLSGGARMVLIATLGPAYANGGESLSTLQFASRCKEIVITPAMAERKLTPTDSSLGSSDFKEREARLISRIRELEDLKSPSFSHVQSEAVLYCMKLLSKLTQTSIQLRKEVGNTSILSEFEQKEDDEKYFEEVNEGLLQMSSESVVEKGQMFARKLAENLNFLGKQVTGRSAKTLIGDPSIQSMSVDLPQEAVDFSQKQSAAKRSNLSLKELLKGKKLTPVTSMDPIPQRKPSTDSSTGSLRKEKGGEDKEKRNHMSRTPEPGVRSGRSIKQTDQEESTESLFAYKTPALKVKSVTPPKKREPQDTKLTPRLAAKEESTKGVVLVKDAFLSQLEDEVQKLGGGDDIDDWLKRHAAA